MNYDDLDPGIREIVRRVRAAGFETTDSGDGVSKPAEWFAAGEAIPFPHVVVATTKAALVNDAQRLADLLGHDWDVEATYSVRPNVAYLFASRPLPPRAAQP